MMSSRLHQPPSPEVPQSPRSKPGSVPGGIRSQMSQKRQTMNRRPARTQRHRPATYQV